MRRTSPVLLSSSSSQGGMLRRMLSAGTGLAAISSSNNLIGSPLHFQLRRHYTTGGSGSTYYDAPRPLGGGGGGGSDGSSSSRYTLDPNSFVLAPPHNTVVNIVPQGTFMVVERLGRYLRTLGPGLHFLLPVVDKIRYVYSSKEQGIVIPHQSAITRDNVMVDIDGILFLQIVVPEKASYNIDNPIFNLISLAQTTMRSEIGKLPLDKLFEERDMLNLNIVDVIKREAMEWGVECKRYEIRDIAVSDIVRQSMDLQAEAERRKRKLILESEGDMEAEANRAKGKKLAQERLAEAQRYTTLQQVEAQEIAIQKLAQATALSIKELGDALQHPKAQEAASLRVADRYLDEFGKIAKETNTIVLSQPIGDGAAFAAQAMSMFKTLNNANSNSAAGLLAGSSSAATAGAASKPTTTTPSN